MAPLSTPAQEQPAGTPEADVDSGDWEQVKTKSRSKPVKVASNNSYSRQVGSPTGPSTPRRRAEGLRPGHAGPVSNGDVGGEGRLGKGRQERADGVDRWRQDSNEWAARTGGKQHAGPVWGAKEAAAKEDSAKGSPAKEGSLKEGAVKKEEAGGERVEEKAPVVRKQTENGAVDLAQVSKQSPKKQPGREAVSSSPREAGILGSGSAAAPQLEGLASASSRPAEPPAKPAVKSSTFSYSAALKVGLPAGFEGDGEKSSPRGTEAPSGKALDGDAGSGNGSFPSLSKSNSRNERAQKGSKKGKEEQGSRGVVAKPNDGKKDEEKRAEDVSPSGKSKVEASKPAAESVVEHRTERSLPAKAEPSKVVEKPNPWGRLPVPDGAISLAEPQQKGEAKEQQAANMDGSGAPTKELQPKGGVVANESAPAEREKSRDPAGLQEGGERREAAKPSGRGWEGRKPNAQRAVQVQAPFLGGSLKHPASRQKTPPRVQLQQQFPTLPTRRAEPLNDLSALPPSAPERIQQRSMAGAPVRNRTPPLAHHAHRPQPVQVPAAQGPNVGVRISPTATPYTPSTAAFTPTAAPFTPSGRISPGLRSYGHLQPPVLVQQQTDGSLAYVQQQPMSDHSWRQLSGGRASGTPRANGPTMMYSPGTPQDYGYALAALSPSSQPGTPLGSPAMHMIMGGGQLPPPPAELLANADALHREVLRYAQGARRTPEARARAESAVLCVRKAIQALWPGSDVEVRRRDALFHQSFN
jgi:hypothetical protein